jgi:glycosyltransferase involved in cell wall biosynthesis
MKITYIISNINKSLAFEWISIYLNKDKFDLNFILLNRSDSDLEFFLKSNNIKVNRIYYKSKRDIPKAIIKTITILKKQKTTIVHTHLFDANMVGLTAAWLMGIKKRIHTRHHSNFHHVYYPKAIKYDKIVNRLSTDIIAISEIVKNILINKENVPTKKVHLIHHGFQLNDFGEVRESTISKLRKKYILTNSTPVIGVISRFTEWKGIQFIIPAFEKLLKNYPHALLILANANGDYKNEIEKLLHIVPEQNYIKIPFEADIFSLYKLFDVFIHVPITNEVEAFGQTYVESLAAGVPSIFTLSGIANEFIKDRQNALVVPHQNAEAIYNAINELLDNKALTAELVSNGKKDVLFKFNLNKMILSLELLYAK